MQKTSDKLISIPSKNYRLNIWKNYTNMSSSHSIKNVKLLIHPFLSSYVEDLLRIKVLVYNSKTLYIIRNNV